PCPCGYRGDWLQKCNCTPHAIDRYRRRFSGPLLDRIDLRVKMTRLDPDDLSGPPGESSAEVLQRVEAARKRQAHRGMLNRDLNRGALDALAWDRHGERLLAKAVVDQRITARGWERVRRVAVTLGDLAESEVIAAAHVAEALSFRGSE
nr:ATP-binding protein [Acidimicrobiia bacterium]